MIEVYQDEADCEICLEPLEELYFNMECHTFHWECLEKHIRLQIQQGKFPIKCPHQNCSTELELKTIRRIDNSLQSAYCESKLKEYLMKNTSIHKQCPTPDCKGIVQYSGNNRRKYQRCKLCGYLICKCSCSEYVCKQCKKEYCLLCSQSHKGLTCDQYQHNQKVDIGKNQFIEYLKTEKVKKCPQCKMWVSKTQGCNHMVCSCKNQFCYVCCYNMKECACGKKKPALEIYPKLQHYYKPKTRIIHPKMIHVEKKKPAWVGVSVKPTVFAFESKKLPIARPKK